MRKLPDPPSNVVRDLFPTSLKSGDGGNTYDGMEQRVRHLETDLSFVKGKLDDMPTKDWVNTRLFWVVGSIAAIVALIAAVQTWAQTILFSS